LGPESGSGIDYSGSGGSGSLRPMEPEENTQLTPTTNMTTAAQPTTEPDAESTESGSINSESTGSESTYPESTGPESISSEYAGSESTYPESSGPGSFNPESTGPGSINPESTGPGSINPESTGPVFPNLGSGASEPPPVTTEPEPVNDDAEQPFQLQLTFEVQGDEFNEETKEELANLLQRLLDLESRPKLTVTRTGLAVEIQVDLGRIGEEKIGEFATSLLTSADNQWLTFRNAYVRVLGM